MENKDLSALHIERKFEVYDIDWVIDDFSLATCGDNWSIQSPEFTVAGFHATKWLIFLTPTSNKHQSDSVVFILKRCSSDAGPTSVYVEWRLAISVSGCDKATAIERICDFGVGTEYKESLKGLKNSIGMIKPFESDLMTIQCRMIVYERAANKEFEPCEDTGISCLSEKLLSLFLSGQDCDLALKIGHKVILAHKAIVCTRIKKLNHLLEEADTDTCNEMDTIDLPNLHYEAMVKIMEYVYSGDSSRVLCEPSLAIYDNVQILDVHYLKEYYHPKKLTFRTSMNAQEASFTWVIRDYLENYEDLIVSPTFSGDCSTTWRLNLFPAKKSNFNYFSVFAENVRKVELGNTCIEFAITDESGGTVFSKWMRRAPSDPEPLGFEKFIRRSMVRSFLTNGILRLTMKLKLPGGEMRSYIKQRNVTVVTSPRKIDSFDLLFRDMQTLSEYSDFSDLFLYNESDCFGIHKSIVTARCSYFVSLLSNAKNKTNCISIPGIKSDIITMLLSYIYSGVVPEAADSHSLAELREAAISCNLPLLAHLCEEVMEVNS